MRRFMSTSTPGPVHSSIQSKLHQALQPTRLEVFNDSHLHSHHVAMHSPQYAGSSETHFRVEVVSSAFAGKRVLERHRMVNEILKEELSGPIHALQIKAKTPEELAKLQN